MSARRLAGSAGVVLAERLRLRRNEVEALALDRVASVGSRSEEEALQPRHLLRSAVTDAIDYALERLEQPAVRSAPAPAAVLSHAQEAARAGVGIDTVIRRFVAGYTTLGDALVQEAAGDASISREEVQGLLRDQAEAIDLLLAAVGEQYRRERARPLSTRQRQADEVRKLLAAESFEAPGLGYDFDRWHIGLVLYGPDGSEVSAAFAEEIDARLISVADDDTVSAWLGTVRPLDVRNVTEWPWPTGLRIGCGERAPGLAGWRTTHRQARAALEVAKRRSAGICRYGEVALLASVLRDDLCAQSLRDIYLRPLEDEKDRGALAKRTLRAYFDTERQITSAASVLGVTRNTVAKRLRAIEGLLNRPIYACGPELECAVLLAELDDD